MNFRQGNWTSKSNEQANESMTYHQNDVKFLTSFSFLILPRENASCSQEMRENHLPFSKITYHFPKPLPPFLLMLATTITGFLPPMEAHEEHLKIHPKDDLELDKLMTPKSCLNFFLSEWMQSFHSSTIAHSNQQGRKAEIGTSWLLPITSIKSYNFHPTTEEDVLNSSYSQRCGDLKNNEQNWKNVRIWQLSGGSNGTTRVKSSDDWQQ